MPKFYVLTTEELDELFQQDPKTAHDGGFQNFIVRLQQQARPRTQEIKLDEDDVGRIRQYAADATRGGWQARMLKIFGRVLGLGGGSVAP
jgi:hypothetical protein